MELFLEALDREVDELHGNGVRMRFIGDRTPLCRALQARMPRPKEQTAGNSGLAAEDRGQLRRTLGHRAGGAHARASRAPAARCAPRTSTKQDFARGLRARRRCRRPDLFIRTGGELRISNFLLWQARLHANCISPTSCGRTSTPRHSARALEDFAGRQRRFGLTGEQSAGGCAR